MPPGDPDAIDLLAAWNSAVLEDVFPEGIQPASSVRLTVDDGVLSEIQKRHSLPTSLEEALLAVADFNQDDPLGDLRRALKSTNAPWYLCVLVVEVLAASRMGDDEGPITASNYWSRFQNAVGRRSEIPNNMREQLSSLWSPLRNYFEVVCSGNRGRLGLPEDTVNTPFRGRRHVNLPVSQVLVRMIDRERLKTAFSSDPTLLHLRGDALFEKLRGSSWMQEATHPLRRLVAQAQQEQALRRSLIEIFDEIAELPSVAQARSRRQSSAFPSQRRKGAPWHRTRLFLSHDDWAGVWRCSAALLGAGNEVIERRTSVDSDELRLGFRWLDGQMSRPNPIEWFVLRNGDWATGHRRMLEGERIILACILDHGDASANRFVGALQNAGAELIKRGQLGDIPLIEFLLGPRSVAASLAEEELGITCRVDNGAQFVGGLRIDGSPRREPRYVAAFPPWIELPVADDWDFVGRKPDGTHIKKTVLRSSANKVSFADLFEVSLPAIAGYYTLSFRSTSSPPAHTEDLNLHLVETQDGCVGASARIRVGYLLEPLRLALHSRKIGEHVDARECVVRGCDIVRGDQ